MSVFLFLETAFVWREEYDLFVPVYVYVSTCVLSCVHACIIRVYIYTYTCTYADIHIHIHACMHARAYTQTNPLNVTHVCVFRYTVLVDAAHRGVDRCIPTHIIHSNLKHMCVYKRCATTFIRHGNFTRIRIQKKWITKHIRNSNLYTYTDMQKGAWRQI
jgi:hypothetical protein